jgi:hypothetical protein
MLKLNKDELRVL